jgi:hypothetical protein
MSDATETLREMLQRFTYPHAQSRRHLWANEITALQRFITSAEVRQVVALSKPWLAEMAERQITAPLEEDEFGRNWAGRAGALQEILIEIIEDIDPERGARLRAWQRAKHAEILR